jgi:cardiolipin synthase
VADGGSDLLQLDQADAPVSNRILTFPNVFSLFRLCCIPVFLYLLFPRDNQIAAAWLLGGLGATDWVDGYVARHFNQVSELGKILDPTADRLLFIVGIGGILVKGLPPTWVFILIVIRELVLGATLAVLKLFFGMKRFDVTWLGKCATALLMFAVPGFMLGSSDMPLHELFWVGSWCLAIPGLILSYYTAVAYVPTIRASLRAGRNERREHAS